MSRRKKSVGSMRYFVKYQRKLEVSDGKGAYVVRWQDFADTHCDFETLSLFSVARYGQNAIEASHKISQRTVDNLEEGKVRALLITENGAQPRVFDVKSVVDLGNRNEYQVVIVNEHGTKQKPLVAQEY